MHRMLALSTTAVIIVAGLAGCSTGPTVTQERDIQDATAVELVAPGIW